MNIVKEKLIIAMIDRRIQNILNNSDEVNWMADVMNFGWIGYDNHTDEELLESAKHLGIGGIPTLEELTDNLCEEPTMAVAHLNGWKVEQYDRYLRVDVDGSPGYITIKQEDEGFVVDIWPDEGNDSAGSTSALYTELELE